MSNVFIEVTPIISKWEWDDDGRTHSVHALGNRMVVNVNHIVAVGEMHLDDLGNCSRIKTTDEYLIVADAYDVLKKLIKRPGGI